MSQVKAMSQNTVTFGDRVIRSIHGYRRLNRLLFPSPAEVQFVRLMRGHALVVPFVKSRRTGFPLTFLFLGRMLRGELIEREVWVDARHRYCLDFATPHASYRKCIEIDGAHHKLDIVREQDRDDYLLARGWSVLHVPAKYVFQDPLRVRRQVLRFLRS